VKWVWVQISRPLLWFEGNSRHGLRRRWKRVADFFPPMPARDVALVADRL